MVWKDSPQIEKVVNEEKIDTSILRKRGNSKTFTGWLIQKIKDARKNENTEMVILLSEIYRTHQEFQIRESKPLVEIEIVEGWKGTDNIEIIKGFTNDFIIKSHLKDKESGQVTEQTHQIPYEKVNTLFFWIKKWKVGEKHKCYDFAPCLGYTEWKDLWKERKDYFELYYYPIKVLEALGLIKYSGRGDVTRIK